MLQKSIALPIFGLIDSPPFPQSKRSFHQGTELKFPLAFGNTVSPPSSTSELYQRITKKKVNTNINFMLKIIEANNAWHWSHLQVHQHCCYTLTRINSTKRIHKVVIMRFILLSNFIMENIKGFTMLCILWNIVQVMVV